MHLLPCDRPTGLLEAAPRTSLSGPGTEANWDGFWGIEDERYYTRCTQADGTEQWYCVADIPAGKRRRETRVIPLRVRSASALGRADARRVVVVGASRTGRTMLVGHSRRRRRDDVAPTSGAR